jgi:hypothetical protein
MPWQMTLVARLMRMDMSVSVQTVIPAKAGIHQKANPHLDRNLTWLMHGSRLSPG